MWTVSESAREFRVGEGLPLDALINIIDRGGYRLQNSELELKA